MAVGTFSRSFLMKEDNMIRMYVLQLIDQALLTAINNVIATDL